MSGGAMYISGGGWYRAWGWTGADHCEPSAEPVLPLVAGAN
jgi:hypothetical protein